MKQYETTSDAENYMNVTGGTLLSLFFKKKKNKIDVPFV